MPRFTIIEDTKGFTIHGDLNEHVDFRKLLQSKAAPLRVSFEGVTSMNSIGTAALVKLNEALAGRDVRYSEVPVFLIQLVNTIPALFGAQVKHIESWYQSFACKDCGLEADMLVKRADIKTKNHSYVVPSQRCTACHGAMQPKVDPDDALLFMTYAA